MQGHESSGLRRYALAGYRWLLLAFLLAGSAQIFLAGLGVFSFGDHDVAGGTSAFDAHRTLGFTLAGVGFATTRHGTGLQGMADRLAALGGALHVRSRPGEGTTLSGELPVSALG